MTTKDQTIGGWLEVLASDSPTPGGGAVAAVVGAAGAALISMTGRLTIGRKGFEDLEERMTALVERADREREAFVASAEDDMTSFDAVMAAFRMPKETEDEKAERSSAIQRGYEGAAVVPLGIARRAVDLMELAEDAAAMGNPNAASDGYSAGAMLYAAALTAIANVRINAAALKDREKTDRLLKEVESLRVRADALLDQTQEAFLLRLSS